MLNFMKITFPKMITQQDFVQVSREKPQDIYYINMYYIHTYMYIYLLFSRTYYWYK